jgi:hypothetical protein
LIASLLLTSLLLVGCNVGTSSGYGWSFWSSGGMRTSVAGTRTDTDQRTVRAKAGEKLVIQYDIEVNRGALSIDVRRNSLRSFGNSTWYRNYDSSSNGTIRIPLEDSGTYEITVTMRQFGGSYDITWETE